MYVLDRNVVIVRVSTTKVNEQEKHEHGMSGDMLIFDTHRDGAGMNTSETYVSSLLGENDFQRQRHDFIWKSRHPFGTISAVFDKNQAQTII
jgi:hypothetical protein